MMQAGADAVIVGSAIVNRISKSKNRRAMLEDLNKFAASLKKACR
jgi:tryptophan synthase alpha subunit